MIVSYRDTKTERYVLCQSDAGALDVKKLLSAISRLVNAPSNRLPTQRGIVGQPG
jgi:hypothetical protein